MSITRKEWNRASYGTALQGALCSSITPDKIRQTLEGMLSAEIVSQGGRTRPDYRTRESAVKLLLAYTVGTPVQRQEQVNYNMDMGDLPKEELLQKLAESPSTREMLQSMLDRANDMAALEVESKRT